MTIFLIILILILIGIIWFMAMRLIEITKSHETIEEELARKKVTMQEFSVHMFELMKSETVFVKYEPRFLELFQIWMTFFKEDYAVLNEEFKKVEEHRMKEELKMNREVIGTVRGGY